MMSRHHALRLCQRLANIYRPSVGAPHRDCPTHNINISDLNSITHFSTSAKIYDNTRIVSGDLNAGKYFDEDDFEDDDDDEYSGRHDFRPRKFEGESHSRPDRKWSKWSRDNLSKRWSGDDRPQKLSGDKSWIHFKDRKSRASYLRDEFQDRQGSNRSMEDLWSQLNENKVDFKNREPVEKNFYAEDPAVANRPQEETKKFMDTHQITVSGKNCKSPIFRFEETGFPDEIVSSLKIKFDQPTPIQSIGWPQALSGNDMVGIAQTGSGKTLSFILPGILHIQAQRTKVKGTGPFALVICPTRELAMQCHEVVMQFRKLCDIKSAVVYGGKSKLIQADQLTQPGIDIVIATPGRLLDFLTTDTVSLRRCSFLVLDEADRMLDMGFEPQIRAIMGQVPPDRQVLMWSATWPEEIQDLASDFLKEYVHVKIGAQTHTVNSDIIQEFHYCTHQEKMKLLFEHLDSHRDAKNSRRPAKTLIFSSTKSQCSRIQSILRRQNIFCNVLHGDKSQRERDDVMLNFRRGRTPVLVASDVASRGLDVTDIEFVINYDLPKTIDSYIHRVGRTGRAGKTGTAISFITAEDLEMINPLMDVLEDAGHEVPGLFHQLLTKREKLKAYRKLTGQKQTRISPRKFRF